MNGKIIAPGFFSGKFYRPIPFLLAAICMAGFLAPPANAAETGIRGTVSWGPVHGGPARMGRSEEAPLSASFLVLGSGKKVSFKSDKKGYFEVSLPPGEYTIVPDKSKPMPFPGKQKKMVTVPEDGFAEVTLRFDTGMR